MSTDLYEDVVGGTVTVKKIGGADAGHGFVWSNGFIVTNHHVSGSDKVQVVSYDGHGELAEVVAHDPWSDIALVKVSDPYIMGNWNLVRDDDVPVGTDVMAIGSPLGFNFTASMGIISGTGRSIDRPGAKASMVGLYQTDAMIYKGSSGGPLFDMSGVVVGMVSSFIPGTGIGFAIPSYTIRKIVLNLMEGL